MFNAAKLPGNTYVLLMLTGGGMTFGIMISGFLLSKEVLKDYLAYMMAHSMIYGSILFPRLIGEMPNSVIYFLFLIRTIGCGMCCNI